MWNPLNKQIIGSETNICHVFQDRLIYARSESSSVESDRHSVAIRWHANLYYLNDGFFFISIETHFLDFSQEWRIWSSQQQKRRINISPKSFLGLFVATEEKRSKISRIS